jgi:hypothetical protein
VQNNEHAKRYRLANPERWSEIRRRSRLKKFGITVDQYDAIMELQGDACGICRKPAVGRRLAVDHDHNCCPGSFSCGKCIRGLLCSQCNRGLGQLGDSADALRRALEYVDRRPLS